MAFDFPSSPTLGQVYSAGGVSYAWNGVGWQRQGATGITQGYVDAQDALRVLKAGDTMSGGLTLDYGDPTLTMKKAAAGNVCQMYTWSAGALRWLYRLTDTDDAVRLYPFDNAGGLLPAAMSIARLTGAMTLGGDVTISKGGTGPTLNLNKTASGTYSGVTGQTNGVMRWYLNLGDAAGESGSNNGSDFVVHRYNDAGGYLGAAFTINRASGNAGIGVTPTAASLWKFEVSGRLMSSGNLASLGVTDRAGAGRTYTWYDPNGNGLLLDIGGGSVGTALSIGATTGNLTSYGGATTLGAGGAAAGTGDLSLNGGSGNTGGPTLAYLRNGNLKWHAGIESRVFGNNNDNLVFWNPNVGLVLSLSYGGGATIGGGLNISGVLSTGGGNITTAGGDVYTHRGNNTGVVFFGNGGGQYLYFDGSAWQLQGGGSIYANEWRGGQATVPQTGSGITTKGYNDSSHSNWLGYNLSNAQTSAIRASGGFESSINSYGGFSDRRLKKNIKPASPKLDDVMKVNIINFEFNDLMPGVAGKQIGVADDEIAELWPSLVYATPKMTVTHPGDTDPSTPESERKPPRIETVEPYNCVRSSVLFGPIMMKAFQEFVTETRDRLAALEAA